MVLGDMLELGDHAVDSHRKLGKAAAQTKGARLVAVGTFAEDIVAGALSAGMPGDQTFFFPGWQEAAEASAAWLTPGGMVLLKASRKIGLDRLLEHLVEKGRS